MKKGLILFFLFSNCSLFAQTQAQRLEFLEGKIARSWSDSLARHIPYLYDSDDYIKVEKEWDQRFFNLENKDVIEYLSLKGKLNPNDASLNGKIFLTIAQQALRESEFHMSLYSKGSSRSMIKPMLAELGQNSCQCLEQKIQTIDKSDLSPAAEEELAQKYLQECFSEKFPGYRSKLFLEYNIKDQIGIQRLTNIVSGYFFTTCAPIIASSAAAKASIWINNIRWQVEDQYQKSVLDIIDAIKENRIDSLNLKFENDQLFEQASAALKKTSKLYKAHPKIVAISRTEDISFDDGHLIQFHHLAENSKAFGQLVLEYQNNISSKLKSVTFIPRKKIKNLAELDEYLAETASELEDVPPPTEEIPKNE